VNLFSGGVDSGDSSSETPPKPTPRTTPPVRYWVSPRARLSPCRPIVTVAKVRLNGQPALLGVSDNSPPRWKTGVYRTTIQSSAGIYFARWYTTNAAAGSGTVRAEGSRGVEKPARSPATQSRLSIAPMGEAKPQQAGGRRQGVRQDGCGGGPDHLSRASGLPHGPSVRELVVTSGAVIPCDASKNCPSNR
jgi:hypothetical protein